MNNKGCNGCNDENRGEAKPDVLSRNLGHATKDKDLQWWNMDCTTQTEGGGGATRFVGAGCYRDDAGGRRPTMVRNKIFRKYCFL